MGRIGITYEQVAQAAETILMEGQNPTIHRVRASLGDTGSITTINKYLNQWKSEKLVSNSIQQTTKAMPTNPVTQAADQLWQQLINKAHDTAQEEIDAVKEDYQLQIEGLNAEKKQLKTD